VATFDGYLKAINPAWTRAVGQELPQVFAFLLKAKGPRVNRVTVDAVG
jgi:hypothetical protein